MVTTAGTTSVQLGSSSNTMNITYTGSAIFGYTKTDSILIQNSVLQGRENTFSKNLVLKNVTSNGENLQITMQNGRSVTIENLSASQLGLLSAGQIRATGLSVGHLYLSSNGTVSVSGFIPSIRAIASSISVSTNTAAIVIGDINAQSISISGTGAAVIEGSFPYYANVNVNADRIRVSSNYQQGPYTYLNGSR